MVTHMDRSSVGSEARFEAFVEALSGVMGHADRAEPLRDYCTGLLLPVDRKSVEPIAAATAPCAVSAKHQSLLHFVGQAPWLDDAVMAKVRAMVLPVIERSGPVRAWIVDDTGFPKKGKHSVGVARQYCGQLGKPDNCQVAVTLSVANDAASLPVAYRLYLPESWASDAARCKKVGVPGDIVFQTKPEIAFDQIKAAQAAGIAPGVVLADAGYGVNTRFRSSVTALGLSYVMGVQGSIGVSRGKGRPVSAKRLAVKLDELAWKKVTWREGTNTSLTSRFAALRVRPTHRDTPKSKPHQIEWLLIEWPKGEKEPTKYWLSTLPEAITLKALVDLAKLRWRIERDYQDLKQEIGLGHYEGRGWRGFHHHAALCIAAYGFLISERETFPPSGPRRNSKRQASAFPENYRPRGAPNSNRQTHSKFNRNTAPTSHRRPGAKTAPMSMLRQGTGIAP